MPYLINNSLFPKNYLINGNFDIWQRGITFGAGNTYKADRWWFQNNTGSIQDRITTSLNGSTYALRNTVNSASNSGYISQSLEDLIVNNLKGKTVTFSCTIRASTSISNVFLNIRKSSTGNTNFSSGIWNQIVASNITVTTSFQTFYVSATIPNDGTANGLLVSVEFPNNLTNGTTWDITQCMLTEGSVIAPFRTAGANIQGELAMCQRYYEVLATTTGSYSVQLLGNRDSSMYFFPVKYSVTKRTSSPTLVRNDGGSLTGLTAGAGAGQVNMTNLALPGAVSFTAGTGTIDALRISETNATIRLGGTTLNGAAGNAVTADSFIVGAPLAINAEL